MSATTPESLGEADAASVSAAALRAALSEADRPARPTAWSASLTFGWRALLKIKHVPMQMFDVTAFPIIMTLMFTYLFGGALAGSPEEYLQDFLPGILVVSVVMITMYTGVAINTDIHKGVFDRFRSLPIWQPAVLVGALLGDVIRYTTASIVILTVGLILGFRPDGGVAGVVAAVLLLLIFAFCISWVWTLIGLKSQTPESVMSISMLFIFPLTFASNVYVDPSTMPGWIQAVVDVNPISHLATAARGLMHGDVVMSQVGWVLLACAVLLVVFGPLTMRSFRAER
jgi:ABC-2 type transport system permease protein